MKNTLASVWLLMLITSCATPAAHDRVRLKGNAHTEEPYVLTLKYDLKSTEKIHGQQLDIIQIDGEEVKERLTDRRGVYALSPFHKTPVLALQIPSGEHTLHFKWQATKTDSPDAVGAELILRSKVDIAARFNGLPGHQYEIQTRVDKADPSRGVFGTRMDNYQWRWKLVEKETGNEIIEGRGQ